MAKPKIMADIAQVTEEVDALQGQVNNLPDDAFDGSEKYAQLPMGRSLFLSKQNFGGAGMGGNVLIEKTNWYAKQTISKNNGSPIKYRIMSNSQTEWEEWKTIATADKFATDSGLPIVSVTEASLDKYNTISDGMPNGTYYKRIVANTVVVPEVGGGNWYLEGVRTSDKWEWQMIRAYHEGFIKFREKANGVWSKFRTIATTHKTDFSCTPATGFKIANQKCYVINNQVFISIALKTTDDSNFATFQTKKAFTVPTAYKPLLHPSVAISCSRVAQGGLPLGNDCANVWFDTGDVWVSNETITNTNYIIVTGSYFI